MGRDDAALGMLAALAIIAGIGIVTAFAEGASGGTGKWPLWDAEGENKPNDGDGPRFRVSSKAYQHTDGTFSWQASYRDLDAKPNDHSLDLSPEGPAASGAEAVASAQAAYHELSGGMF